LDPIATSAGVARRVEYDGGDLVAGNLADGEISLVKPLPPFSMASKWGRLTPQAPPVYLSAPAWVHCTECTQCFKREFLEKDLEMIFQKIVKYLFIS
jgi:hypothetical protein